MERMEARAGHDVVMTPANPCYFDCEPNLQQMEKVYQFDPTADLYPAQAPKVLGTEGEM